MDPILATLAANAANVFVQAVTTDGWEAAKRRVTDLWHHWHPADDALIGAQIDKTHERMTKARSYDDAEAADVAQGLETTWTESLKDLLREAPDAAADLRELVAALAPASDSQQAGTITQTARAEGGSTVIQAGRDVKQTRS